MSLARTIADHIRQEGVSQTALHALRSLADCRYELKQEPFLALEPLAPSPAFERGDGSARIAIQLHLFYPQLAEALADVVNRIPYRFDCYVSTDSDEKAARLEQAIRGRLHAASLQIEVFDNRGRDVAPLLSQMAPRLDRYDYLCHIHGKHSAHRDFGNEWRDDLLRQLLGSPGYIAAELNLFERNPRAGLLFPPTFHGMKRYGGWRGNKPQAEALMRQLGLPPRLPTKPDFPVGNMFWARTKAVAPVFQCQTLTFPPEARQLENTMAHCIERCWVSIAKAEGYDFFRVRTRETASSHPRHQDG